MPEERDWRMRAKAKTQNARARNQSGAELKNLVQLHAEITSTRHFLRKHGIEGIELLLVAAVKPSESATADFSVVCASARSSFIESRMVKPNFLP